MNNRALRLSLLFAVMAVFMVQSYVASIEENAKEKFGVETIVITAKKDVKEMENLNETMLELTRIPKRYLEPAAISFDASKSEKDAIGDMKKLAGTVAIVPIKKGEQITYNKITEPNIRTGLSPQITPGQRAMAIPVNETTGVAKLVKPGDRVDLIAVVDADLGRDNKVAKTVLQDVVVLAVGRFVTNNIPRLIESSGGRNKRVRNLARFDGFSSVTLEVDPSEAQKLALLMAAGNNTLTLSLRNTDDTDRVKVPGTMIFDVMGPDINRLKSRIPAAARRRR